MEDRVLLLPNIFLHYFRTMNKIFLFYDKHNIYIQGPYTHYTSLGILIHPKLFLLVVQVRLFQSIGNLPRWNFRIFLNICVEHSVPQNQLFVNTVGLASSKWGISIITGCYDEFVNKRHYMSLFNTTGCALVFPIISLPYS